jgi:hypothetical protein
MSTTEAPITLEHIKAEHTRLAQLIEQLQASATTTYGIPQAFIELAPGERYAGIVLNGAGEPLHHLVLLPGDVEDITWPDAMEWAKKSGGDLPTRQEQALLFANLKDEFQAAWYWSSQEHHSEGSYAWFQNFGFGGQGYSHESYEGRARAVRRFKV